MKFVSNLIFDIHPVNRHKNVTARLGTLVLANMLLCLFLSSLVGHTCVRAAPGWSVGLEHPAAVLRSGRDSTSLCELAGLCRERRQCMWFLLALKTGTSGGGMDGVLALLSSRRACDRLLWAGRSSPLYAEAGSKHA